MTLDLPQFPETSEGAPDRRDGVRRGAAWLRGSGCDVASVLQRGPHRIVNFQGELDLTVQLLQLLLHGRFWDQERMQHLGLSSAERAAWPDPLHLTESLDPFVRAGRGPAPAPRCLLA